MNLGKNFLMQIIPQNRSKKFIYSFISVKFILKPIDFLNFLIIYLIIYRLHVVPDYELVNPLSEINLNGCVTGLGCIESAFLLQCSRGINDYQHPDLPPLLVCLQYLTQLEVKPRVHNR